MSYIVPIGRGQSRQSSDDADGSRIPSGENQSIPVETDLDQSYEDFQPTPSFLRGFEELYHGLFGANLPLLDRLPEPPSPVSNPSVLNFFHNNISKLYGNWTLLDSLYQSYKPGINNLSTLNHPLQLLLGKVNEASGQISQKNQGKFKELAGLCIANTHAYHLLHIAYEKLESSTDTDAGSFLSTPLHTPSSSCQFRNSSEDEANLSQELYPSYMYSYVIHTNRAIAQLVEDLFLPQEVETISDPRTFRDEDFNPNLLVETMFRLVVTMRDLQIGKKNKERRKAFRQQRNALIDQFASLANKPGDSAIIREIYDGLKRLIDEYGRNPSANGGHAKKGLIISDQVLIMLGLKQGMAQALEAQEVAPYDTLEP